MKTDLINDSGKYMENIYCFLANDVLPNDVQNYILANDVVSPRPVDGNQSLGNSIYIYMFLIN